MGMVYKDFGEVQTCAVRTLKGERPPLVLDLRFGFQTIETETPACRRAFSLDQIMAPEVGLEPTTPD